MTPTSVGLGRSIACSRLIFWPTRIPAKARYDAPSEENWSDAISALGVVTGNPERGARETAGLAPTVAELDAWWEPSPPRPISDSGKSAGSVTAAWGRRSGAGRRFTSWPGGKAAPGGGKDQRLLRLPARPASWRSCAPQYHPVARYRHHPQGNLYFTMKTVRGHTLPAGRRRR